MAKKNIVDPTIVEKELESVEEPVSIVVHFSGEDTEMMEQVKARFDSLNEKYEKLDVKYVQEEGEPEDQIHHLVDHFPAYVILDKDGNDHGIRFYGAPLAGLYEAFLRTILLVSGKGKEMDEEIQKKIQDLEDTDLQILVTPNAPNIQETLLTALELSYRSDKVKTSVIDLIQFPDIAEQYMVLGIPKTIINESQRYTGPYDMNDGLEILIKSISDAE
ncbi:MAG: hypothetical protein U9R75_06380 [Candidatus Thermoplasmatota archaeon]|nr:hypothetical protein [Candidatus Thermoplasmatota archaeon]